MHSLSRKGVIVLTVVLLAVCCALEPVRAAVAGTCGSAMVGTWVAKLQPQQVYPTPTPKRAQQYRHWTYAHFIFTENSNTFTISLTGQTTSNKLGCTYTCKEQDIVSHDLLQYQVTGGVVAPEHGNSEEAFGCPTSPQEVQPQLLALCDGSHKFDMVIKPLKIKEGTWTHNVTFLGANLPNQQQTSYYISCFTGSKSTLHGFRAVGSMKLYVPYSYNPNWITGPGTIILMVCFLAFAGGWLFLFWSIREKEEPPIEGAEDDDTEEGSSSESESETDSEDDSGSEGSETGSETGSDDDRYTTQDDDMTYTDGASVMTGTTGYGESVVSNSEYTNSVAAEDSISAAAHCANCGTPIYDSAAEFCPNCGQPVHATA